MQLEGIAAQVVELPLGVRVLDVEIAFRPQRGVGRYPRLLDDGM
jgi:hypothetical protein